MYKNVPIMDFKETKNSDYINSRIIVAECAEEDKFLRSLIFSVVRRRNANNPADKRTEYHIRSRLSQYYKANKIWTA